MSESTDENGICLRCQKQNNETYIHIFDETGVEMQLSTLLKECFGITIMEDTAEFQALCSSCLDELIEIYDLNEMNLMKESSNSTNITIETTQNENGHQSTSMLEEERIDINGDLTPIRDEIPLEENESTSLDSNREEFLGFDEGECSDDSQSELGGVQYIDELDSTNLLEYKLKLFGSDLKQINIPLSLECRLCSAALDSHKTVYAHSVEQHKDDQYLCVVDAKCKPMKSSVELSYHLILTHYDLDSFDLFCSCPVCGNSFKNFKAYNRHSCHKQKNLSRVSQECTQCLKTFSSNKRFRFHHQFHMKNHRPKACLICDEHFRDEDDFYEHIMYKHIQDSKLVCTMCDRNFTSEASLQNHLALHLANRKYKCSFCSKDYMYSHMLTNHVKENHINKKPYECDICSKAFIKESVLKTHKKQYHTISIEKEIDHCGCCGLIEINEKKLKTHLKTHKKNEQNLEKKNLLVAMVCEHCEAAFASIDQLKDHRKKHSSNEFICNFCPVIQDEFKKLMTHKLTHKNFEEMENFPITRHYVCNVEGCNTTHILWTGLRAHKTSKHPISGEVVHCLVCKVQFSRMPELNVHMKTQHEDLKLVSCPVCEKFFNNRTAMSVHLSRIHNTAKMKCDKCESSFHTEESLARHKDYRHGKTECSICKKVLKSRNFELHMNLVHKNIKRFFCSVCDKGYYQRSDWLEHKRAVHEKERRFKCNLCDYETYWINSMKIHDLKHTKVRPFACKYCRSNFDHNSGLQRHLRSHKIETKFVCPFSCEVFFTSRLILIGHLEDFHLNEPGIENILSSLTDKRRKCTKAGPGKRSKHENNTKTGIFIDDDDGLEHHGGETINDESVCLYEIQNIFVANETEQETETETETVEIDLEGGIIIEEC